MQEPYSRVSLALSYFKGDKVEEWASDQLMLLQEKVHVQGRDLATDIMLWDDFREDFFRAWGDTMKAQRADLEIQKHMMKGKSIDEYTSTFEVLLRRAGWTQDDQSTIKEFVQGLPMWLANHILARSPPPNKARLLEWIYAARDEVVKDQERMTMLGGYGKRNDIVRDNRQKHYNIRPSGNKT